MRDKFWNIFEEHKKKNIGCANCVFADFASLPEGKKRVGYSCKLKNDNKFYLYRCWRFIHKDSKLNKIRIFVIRRWDWLLNFIVSFIILILTIINMK